jgi:hypothetical protein
MTNLEQKFEALESQLATQNTALLSAMGTIGETLALINTALDTLNSNGATNTRLLLAAINQNGPCAVCPTPPLVIPPVGTVTHAINEDKCKRTQAFLHAMQLIAEVFDTITFNGLTITPSLISDAVSQVIAVLDNPDTTPLPSFPESVNIAGDSVSYVVGNITRGGTLSGDLASLILDMQDAIFAAGDQSADQAAYNAVIDGSELPFYSALLLKALAYNELWNYYFDPASTPNLVGFSGTACGTSDCLTITAEVANIGGALRTAIVWPTDVFTSSNNDGAGTSADKAIWCTTDLIGWTITPTLNIRVFPGGGGHFDVNAGDTAPFSHTTFCAVIDPNGTTGFDITICPPVPE